MVVQIVSNKIWQDKKSSFKKPTTCIIWFQELAKIFHIGFIPLRLEIYLIFELKLIIHLLGIVVVVASEEVVNAAGFEKVVDVVIIAVVLDKGQVESFFNLSPSMHGKFAV